MERKGHNSGSDEKAEQKGPWEIDADAGGGETQIAWGSLSEAGSSEPFISETPEAITESATINAFSDSLGVLCGAMLKYYENGDLEGIPPLRLEDEAIDSLIKMAESDDGKKKLSDLIEAQATKAFGDDFRREIEESGMDVIHVFGLLSLSSVVENQKVMSNDELKQWAPQAKLLKALGFNESFLNSYAHQGLSYSFNGVENLINLGLATDQLHNDIREYQIEKFFCDSVVSRGIAFVSPAGDKAKEYFFDHKTEIIPECLQSLDDEANAYWNEQSRVIGCDALSLALKEFDGEIICGSGPMKRKGGVDLAVTATATSEMFTDTGRLQDSVFSKKDGIIGRITNGAYAGFQSLYPFSEENYARFIAYNTPSFPPDKQWIARELEKTCFDENGEFREKEFSSFCHLICVANGWENSLPSDDEHPSGRPNPKFLARAIANTSTDYSIVEKFDEYEATASEEEKALMSIPFEIRSRFIDTLRHASPSHFSDTEFLADLLPKVLTADGSITSGLVHLSVKDKRLFEVVSQINPNLIDMLTPLERRFMDLPEEAYKKLVGDRYLSESDYSKLLQDGSPEDVATIVQFSIGHNRFERFLLRSNLDFNSIDIPPGVRAYLMIDESYRDLIRDFFQNNNESQDAFAPFVADSYIKKMNDFISDNGPTQGLVDLTWESGKFSLLVDKPIVDLDSFEQTDRQRKILDIYAKIDHPSLRSEFESFINGDGTDYESIPEGFLDKIPGVFSRMLESNASEIRSMRVALAREILKAGGDPEETVERIEAVFLRNHLPYFAKAFLVFRMLHPDSRLAEKIGGETVSPVLKTERDGDSMFDIPERIILSDMVNCAVKSNNRSVRDFIEQIETGQDLVEQLLGGKKTFDNLDAAESAKLNSFIQQLIILYNQTVAGQNNPRSMPENLSETELRDLVGAFGTTSRYSLGDRIVRMWGFFAGFDSIKTAKAKLEAISIDQTERHRRLVEDGRLTLEAGDIIKGLNSTKWVSNILQNGSLAQEFLGDSAGSDATPLDTDVSVIREVGDNLQKTISSVVAGSYGGEDKIWVVMKRDDRFSVTRENPDFAEDTESAEPSYDPSKLELFYTGAIGQDHYGIRTGFPSSEIDFFIKGDDVDRLEIEIVKNGFYIPIINTEGELVFTPGDYDRLRGCTAGQSYYGNPDYSFGRLETPEITEIASQLGENTAEVSSKRAAIYDVVREVLSEIVVDGKPLTLKTFIDGDITPGAVELIDTGSTGRGTNVPGDGDFDFIMRLDRSILDNPLILEQIKSGILSRVVVGKPGDAGGDFRHKDVKVPGLDSLVDIDISFVQRTNKMEYSTDAAIRDVLASIAAESERERAAEIAERETAGLSLDDLGPTRYEYVLANIIAAKEFFKSAPVHAYKPARGEKPQGGLGGVGVENWILQHGGSFEDAAKDLLAAARKAEEAVGVALVAGDETVNSSGGSPNERVFREFQKIYRVWDFGQNHFAVRDTDNGAYRFPHDNFVYNNMSAGGFSRIVFALRERFPS